jgi:hypothetical protein
VSVGGKCKKTEYLGAGAWSVCDGLVEAVPPNAPRDPQGRPRVRKTVRLLPETARWLRWPMGTWPRRWN